VGSVYRFGPIEVTEAEIIAFAKKYDPQSFHTDPAHVGPYGGLIASGWLTAALAMRLYVDHYLTSVASLASPGIDELRWLRPVRPGDNLYVRIEIIEARPSRSKPDRGIVKALVEAFNQSDQLVMSLQPISLIGRRPDPSAGN
jgi:acyl dehydratase